MGDRKSMLFVAFMASLALGACAVDGGSPSYDATTYNPWPANDLGVSTYDGSNYYSDGSSYWDSSTTDCLKDEYGWCIDGGPPLNAVLPRGMYRIALMRAKVTLEGQKLCAAGAFKCDPYVRLNYGEIDYVHSSSQIKTYDPYWANEILLSSISSDDLLMGFSVVVMDDNPDATMDTPIAVCPGLINADTLRGRELTLQCDSAVVWLTLTYLSAI